jgi:transposase-like protein
MVNTKCKKCDYTWNYNGKLMRRTCPNCGYNWIVKKGRPIGSHTKKTDIICDVAENVVVEDQQVIQIEIERLITSLKNHHYSIGEIRKFIKTSMGIINEEYKRMDIKPLTFEELSEMLRCEADKKGIRCIG